MGRYHHHHADRRLRSTTSASLPTTTTPKTVASAARRPWSPPRVRHQPDPRQRLHLAIHRPGTERLSALQRHPFPPTGHCRSSLVSTVKDHAAFQPVRRQLRRTDLEEQASSPSSLTSLLRNSSTAHGFQRMVRHACSSDALGATGLASAKTVPDLPRCTGQFPSEHHHLHVRRCSSAGLTERRQLQVPSLGQGLDIGSPH